MKIFIQSPDAQGRIDPTVTKNLLAFIPNQVSSQGEADLTLIPISWMPGFEVNPELEQIKGKVCIIDFCEWGSHWRKELTHYWGGPQSALSCVLGASWYRFNAWAASRQPVLTLKRELLANHIPPKIKPIDFLCYLPPVEIQSKAEFDKRPLEALFWWGFSHRSRPRLHADIFRAMTTHGIEVVSYWDQWAEDRFKGRTWASIHTPHFVRKHISEIIPWHERSKITVALPGNGEKTFRHSEIVGSIMALHDDGLEYSFPWVHGENCIRLVPDHEFDCLESSTRREDLYEIYLAGQINLDRYRSGRYVNEYIMPLLEAAI